MSSHPPNFPSRNRAPRNRPLRVTLLMDTRAWAGTESHVLTLARSLRDLNASAGGAGAGDADAGANADASGADASGAGASDAGASGAGASGAGANASGASAGADTGDAGAGDSLVEVTIATPPGSPLWERARAAGLPTLAIARRGTWDSDTLQTLTRRVRRGACDVIHAHNGRTALWGALAVKGAGRGACVFTHHFIEPAHAQSGGALGSLKKRVHALLAGGIAGHIAISQAVAEAINERGEVELGRLTVVPNGISAPAVADAGAADLPAELRAEIACVARLQKEKGLPTLVRALALLKAQRPAAGTRSAAPRCVIAGEGDERAALEALIREQDAGDVVYLAGFTPYVGAILSASRVSVLPSPAEPFGLAVIEAMAQGRAVVAVDAGGPREIVVEGVTGLLVPPDDAPALARALAQLLDDPARAQAMGRAGFERYQTHFTAARMARQTVEVYQKARH